MSDALFEDSILAPPGPTPKAPHDFRLTHTGPSAEEIVSRFVCIHCGLRQNQAGEFCTGRTAVK